MGDEDIAALVPHIAGLRMRARQARRLASEINDAEASAGLMRHAAQLDRQADELEARVAALKKASHNGAER